MSSYNINVMIIHKRALSTSKPVIFLLYQRQRAGPEATLQCSALHQETRGEISSGTKGEKNETRNEGLYMMIL